MQYRDAGVDIDRANSIVRGIAGLAKPTWGPAVLSEIGSFGGLFDAAALGPDAVLVASMDGVGTKLAVARMAGRWEGVGEDLVNHSVNDILVVSMSSRAVSASCSRARARGAAPSSAVISRLSCRSR